MTLPESRVFSHEPEEPRRRIDRVVVRVDTVAVIGNYGNINLGDDATLATIVEHVTRRHPKAKTIALAVDPEAVQASTASRRSHRDDTRNRAPLAAPEPTPASVVSAGSGTLRPIASIVRGPLDLLVG